MDRLFYFLFVSLAITSANDLTHKYYGKEYRKAKFFGVGLVRFANSVCTSADGLDGTCYTKLQCRNAGGIQSGTCASNVGVCCVVQGTCGGSSSYNNTYFVNPGFPTGLSSGTSCTFTIEKFDSNICQVRINFLSFTLAQPNANGSCIYDSFDVVEGASKVPTICGDNSGQHIYVDFNGDTDIRLIVETSSDVSLVRSWKLEITQISCDSESRAPAGCLMYYAGTSGTVKSFNYGKTTSSELLANGQPGTRELANLNYGVCVGVQSGYCAITWSQTSNVYSFTVSDSTTIATGTGTVGTTAAGLSGENCTTDFVVIPNPYDNGVSHNTDRFCGNSLPTLTTYSKPFVLTVVTDANELNDSGNRGFALSYSQVRCSRQSYFKK